jgi:hypothetical protein
MNIVAMKFSRSERRVRTRAHKCGYHFRRNSSGSYRLLTRDGLSIFYDATLTAIDNFLRQPTKTEDPETGEPKS